MCCLLINIKHISTVMLWGTSSHLGPDIYFNPCLKQTCRTAVSCVQNWKKKKRKTSRLRVTKKTSFCIRLLTLGWIGKPPADPETIKREHISPTLASLLWLPVKSRYEFKILLTYEVLTNQILYLLKTSKYLIIPGEHLHLHLLSDFWFACGS